MNATLTPEVQVSLKNVARRTGKAKVRPITEEPVEQTQPGSPPELDEAMKQFMKILGCTECSDSLPLDIQAATTSDPLKRTQEEAVILTPEKIVELTQEAGTEFFPDQRGNVFAWIRKTNGEKSHFECLRIRSGALQERLLELVKAKTKTVPRLAALKHAVEILEIQACGTTKKDIDVRRAVVGDEIFIDIGDPEWRMVAINRQGWRVCPQNGPRFFRPQHMLALPMPVGGGDAMDLYNFIPMESEEEKLLVTTWLLAGMDAAIPNPIIIFNGPQGSAKTTRSLRLRSLLDPSVIPVLGDLEMPDLTMIFQHHAVPCFENVSRIKRSEADKFCRAVTGNGVERRKKYTDSDQVLYAFRRPIIMNGIDTPSTRPDFLDRCLIINCTRMKEFTTLQELDQQFEAARPRLFGAMLDLLVKTLAVLDTIPSASEFRMADFARFGRAVAIALGKQPQDFDEAYRLNIRHRHFEVLEDAPMTRILKEFATEYTEATPWTGTAGSLLDALHKLATDKCYPYGKKDLPGSACRLSGRLGEMASALATEGIVVTKLSRKRDRRGWQIFAK